MKTLTVCVAAALGLAVGAGAYAAEANNAVVYQGWDDIVAPSQQAAYEAADKAFNQCLREHGAKYSTLTYTHETGNTYAYSYVVGPYAWADFDAFEAEFKPCVQSVAVSQINPHLQSETSAFMVLQPDMTYMPADWRTQPTPALLDVVTYTLKPGRAAGDAFTAAVKKITAASVKAKSPVYYSTMAIQAAGDGAPDYVLVIGRKSWADYGTLVNSSLRKMLEGVYGKAATDALLKSFEDSIAKASEHIDRYNAGLSYIAGK